jgi:diaminopimelate epimerase
MNKKIEFIKMHGLGNDFVVIDAINQNLENIDLSEFAQNICNRHFGIGADGLILATLSDSSDIRMQIFNSDGSEAEMCGNGIRCFAKFIHEKGIINKDIFSVETLAGVILPAVNIENGIVKEVEVDIGPPYLERGKIPMIGIASDIVLAETIVVDNTEYIITCVSMGNPHVVVFVNDLKQINIEKIGPLFEKHKLFPKKINTEFAQVINRNEVAIVVWERGVGETLSCGTGASAVVVAGVLNNKLDRKVVTHLSGGDLFIEWQKNNDHVVLTGPVNVVFKGELTIT